MASELTVDYSMNYRVTIDLEEAKDTYPDTWGDCDDDEEFEEWIRDIILGRLTYFEERKERGADLPRFITEFSLNERLA